MTDEERKEAGLRIKKRRKELRLTQQELADRIHKAVVSVRQYESGSRVPDLTTKVAIANALNSSCSWLFGTKKADPQSMNNIDFYELGHGDPNKAFDEPTDVVYEFTNEDGTVENIPVHYDGKLSFPEGDRNSAMHSFLVASLTTNTRDLSTRNGREDNYVDIDGEMLSRKEYNDLLEEMKSGSDYIKNRYLQYIKRNRGSRPANRYYYDDNPPETPKE